MFLVQDTFLSHYFSVSKVDPMFLDIVRGACPGHVDFLALCDDYEDTLELVVDHSVVPEHWFDGEEAGDKYSSERTSTWCYERCLSNTIKLSTSDILNPST